MRGWWGGGGGAEGRGTGPPSHPPPPPHHTQHHTPRKGAGGRGEEEGEKRGHGPTSHPPPSASSPVETDHTQGLATNLLRGTGVRRGLPILGVVRVGTLVPKAFYVGPEQPVACERELGTPRVSLQRALSAVFLALKAGSAQDCVAKACVKVLGFYL